MDDSFDEDKGIDAGRLVIVIGQSGSGHSTALDCLEDAGFSAIDNLPLALTDQLVALSVETEKKQLAVITGESERLSRLITNVLTFSKEQKGKLQLRKKKQILRNMRGK